MVDDKTNTFRSFRQVVDDKINTFRPFRQVVDDKTNTFRPFRQVVDDKTNTFRPFRQVADDKTNTFRSFRHVVAGKTNSFRFHALDRGEYSFTPAISFNRKRGTCLPFSEELPAVLKRRSVCPAKKIAINSITHITEAINIITNQKEAVLAEMKAYLTSEAQRHNP